MRLSTIALTFVALGVASVSAVPSSEASASIPVARDFARKMEVRDPRKHHTRAHVYKNGMLTYYYGSQLNNPSCGGKAPSDSDHVVAVKHGGKFKCGQKLHLHHGGKMLEVTVRDTCASCDDMHLDGTKGTFSHFADLSQGEIHGMHIVPQ
jgi:hypothetical protein